MKIFSQPEGFFWWKEMELKGSFLAREDHERNKKSSGFRRIKIRFWLFVLGKKLMKLVD